MSPLRRILVILTVINIVTCLPITSKPIEKRPEDWSWDAWLLEPSKPNKTRKVTPKSIFILPNKTVSQVTCPPDYRIDNFKCIKTIKIDNEEILLSQFANIFNNASYDYDYDYGEDIEEPHIIAESSDTRPDYNVGPLKIDLLGQLPNSKDVVSTDFSSEDELNPQPFRGEDSSSTTTSTPTTTSTSESDNRIPEQSTTTASPTASTTTATETSSTILSVQSVSGTIEFSSSSSTTSTTTATPLTTTTAEIVVANNTYDDADDDYGLIEEHSKRTNVTDGVIEFETGIEVNQTDLKEELINESLLEQNTHQPTTFETIEPTKSTENPFRSVQERSNSSSTPNTTSFSLNRTTPWTNPTEQNANNPQIWNEQNNTFGSKGVAATTIQIQDDPEPIMESIESNNRFVYNHLGSENNSRNQERTESTTPDVQEQLRIINKIVEENRKRAEQASVVKFPTDTSIQTDNLRADFIRFPGPTSSRIMTPVTSTRLFTDKTVIPILRQPPVLLTPPTSTTIAPSTTTERPNSKPFWWLPSDWEVDRSGERPLLLRFWSRAAPTDSSSSSTTTGLRENSRRPTDNLYREIFAPDVRVFGAQNRHGFT